MTYNCIKRKSLIFRKQKKNTKSNTLLVVTTLIVIFLSGISSGLSAGILTKPISQPFKEKSTGLVSQVLTIAKIDEDTTALKPMIKSSYQRISPENAKIMINEDKDIVVIDVRSFEDYEVGHIENALLIPFSGCDSCFINKTESYRSKNIIVYDENGKQSNFVCSVLVENSFKYVYLLEGGIQSWRNNGFPFVKDTSLKTGKKTDNSTKIYGLGYVPPTIEVQPTVFLASLDNPLGDPVGSPPAAWDWRNATYNGTTGDWMTGVRNQGNCGTCWDFSALGALEAIINIRNNDPTIDLDLSEQYLLSCYSSGWGCSTGSNAISAYQYMYNNGGAIPESCFPYSANEDEPCSDKCSDWSSKLIPISGYGRFNPTDRTSIKNQLIALGPLVAEMTVFNDFYSYHGGIYNHTGQENTGQINHQVVIVGYNDNPGYWICKNSWGTAWGENGFFRIAYGDCMIEHEITFVQYVPVGPQTYIISGPSGTINYNDVTFVWSGSDDSTPTSGLVYSYMLEGYDTAWSSWTSATSISYNDLANGNYTFKVRAKDLQGNYDFTPATRSFIVEMNPPVLDQAQTLYNNIYTIWSVRWSAQSFKPSKAALTMVELYIGKFGSITTNLIVSIRSSITGPDLISVSKASSQILTDMHWEGFDFSDYSLNPGSTYYIVVRTSGGTSTQYYIWGDYNTSNPYVNGSFWMSTNSGSSWTEYATFDFCFRTYSGTNPPPNTPVTPSGPSNRITNQEGYYITSATDPDGDQVQYMFDWDASGSHNYSDWTNLMNSGMTGGLSHSWNTVGTYLIKARARDENGIMSGWSTGYTVVVSEVLNNNPNTPIVPSGPASLIVGQSGTYSTSATDPDGDTVQYQFDWNAGGSHDYSGWTSFVSSGQTVSMSHSWSSAGTYIVCAQARDVHGSVSVWSTGLTVTVTSGANVLDQQSTNYDKSNTIFSSRWSAQSFKPSLGVLSKVQLYVGKTGSPTTDLVVSIRSSLTGSDLTSVTKSSSSINTDLSWVEFDFTDISVTTGNTYYLVVRTSGGTSTQNYLWGYGYNNPYSQGSFRMSTNSGISWTEYASYDFCFKIYGQGGGNSPPNAPTVPSGPASRMIGESGAYSTSAVDPNADQVQYRFDWNAGGSHDYSSWTSLVSSGQTVSMSHSWSTSGNYIVRAQAKDVYGNEGLWSSGLTVAVTASNSAPYTPNSPNPGNHATGVIVNADLSWTGGDPDGDTVTYDVYFGTTTTPSKVSANLSATTYNLSTMNYNTKYYWKIISWDEHGLSTIGPLWDFTTGSTSNNPPNTPSVPIGSASRLVGQSGTYSTSAIDPDGDTVQYQFDWNAGGSHDYSGWTSFVSSGQTVSMSHSWSNAGTYIVCAQARDVHGSVSVWSAGLTVTVTSGANVLDQQSTNYDKSNTVFISRWSAQSFKPSLGVLSKVQLYVGKTGSPTTDFVVSIRSSLTGSDLTSVTKSSSSITTDFSWVEFDFTDISVTTGNTYYLVVRTSGGTSTQNYLWGYGYNNPYSQGSFRMSTNSGSSWTEYTSYDFCFKTYGI